FTYGMAMLAMHRGSRNLVIAWLGLTFVLGASFVGLEITEFRNLILEGNGPTRSAFLSAFFTLVSTHGLHVSTGLLWMIVLMSQILKKGLTVTNSTRMMTLSLFWHFLDIVWICVFTFVYLMGAM
ncbi:MAG TPA: cytochrome c oxidase subunit 3, partial [Spirochaetia bacterium]|nr:cytochrome c oxidase subunit 3 [Spirochaetia bacterium]